MKLVTALAASCCLFGSACSAYGQSADAKYLVACEDKDARDAIMTTFLYRQWVLVAILSRTNTAADATVGGLGPKKGIGGCILHDLSDPIPQAMIGKYTWPLRAAPKGMFDSEQGPRVHREPGPWFRPPRKVLEDVG